MDATKENLPKNLGYEMGNTFFKIICYANDAIPISDSEDNLQQLLNILTSKQKNKNRQ